MPIVKQLSVFLENKPGTLGRIGDAFAAAKINILGMSVSDTVDHAVVRLVVDDPPLALSVLEERNVLVLESEIVAAEVPNRPGSLAELGALLAQARVNIDYAYGSAATNQAPGATLYLHVSDPKTAEEVIRNFAKKKGK